MLVGLPISESVYRPINQCLDECATHACVIVEFFLSGLNTVGLIIIYRVLYFCLHAGDMLSFLLRTRLITCFLCTLKKRQHSFLCWFV